MQRAESAEFEEYDGQKVLVIRGFFRHINKNVSVNAFGKQFVFLFAFHVDDSILCAIYRISRKLQLIYSITRDIMNWKCHKSCYNQIMLIFVQANHVTLVLANIVSIVNFWL